MAIIPAKISPHTAAAILLVWQFSCLIYNKYLPVNILSNRVLSTSHDLRRCLATDSQTSCAVLVILWWAWQMLMTCTTYENPKWVINKLIDIMKWNVFIFMSIVNVSFLQIFYNLEPSSTVLELLHSTKSYRNRILHVRHRVGTPTWWSVVICSCTNFRLIGIFFSKYVWRRSLRA